MTTAFLVLAGILLLRSSAPASSTLSLSSMKPVQQPRPRLAAGSRIHHLCVNSQRGVLSASSHSGETTNGGVISRRMLTQKILFLSTLVASKASASELLDFRLGELKGVEKKLKDTGISDAAMLPDDLSEAQQLLLAEKTVLDTSIDFLKENQAFLKGEVQNIKENSGRFIQHMVLKVPDLDKEIKFWRDGYGFKVVRERLTGDGKRTAFIANSPESLRVEDGGSFALELVETKAPVNPGNGLVYMQIRVGDTPRLSQIMTSGGTINFAYGYLQTTTPAGYKVNLYVGDARRDPFELIALRVGDIKQSAEFYKNALGMREVPLKENSKYVDAYGPLYGFGGLLKKEFEKEDVFTPKPPKGSKYLTYHKNENMTMGILLIPQDVDINVGAVEIKKNTPIDVGDGFSKLAIVTNDIYKEKNNLESLPGMFKPQIGFTGEVKGVSLKDGSGTKVSVFTDMDGYQGVWVDYDDFEDEQPKPPKPTSLVEEFEQAMAQANTELAAARKKAQQESEYEALGDAVRGGEGYANV